MNITYATLDAVRRGKYKHPEILMVNVPGGAHRSVLVGGGWLPLDVVLTNGQRYRITPTLKLKEMLS